MYKPLDPGIAYSEREKAINEVQWMMSQLSDQDPEYKAKLEDAIDRLEHGEDIERIMGNL